MDAGRAYNTFPLMGGQLVPEEYFNMTGVRNFFENTAAVQFDHRVLAVSTLTAVSALWLAHRNAPLPSPCKKLLHATAAMTAAQVSLGIATLLTYVPVSLGSLHQTGALTLFTIILALLHTLRPVNPSALALMVHKLAVPGAVAGSAAVGFAVTQTV